MKARFIRLMNLLCELGSLMHPKPNMPGSTKLPTTLNAYFFILSERWRSADLRARLRARLPIRTETPSGASRARISHRPICGFALVVVLAVVTADIVVASTSLANLGKPANILPANAYFPLGGFQKAVSALRPNSPHTVLWIGTADGADASSATERWAVVKALDQFGTFYGLKAAPQRCTSVGGTPICDIATFDWIHARFASRFISFVHRDMLNYQGRDLNRLTPQENALFKHYVEIKACGPVPLGKTEHEKVVATATYHCPESMHRFPLILIGHYAETVSADLSSTDLETFVAGPNGTQQPTGVSFEAIHDSLLHGKDPSGGSVVEAVNREANIIAALICRQDGAKPRSVCSRSVIRSIASHAH